MPPRLSKPFRLKTDAEVARAMRPSVAKKSARELESAVQARIVEALEALGCLVERRGEAGGRGGKGGGAFKTGEPDLRVSYRGRTFGIEVKRDAAEPLRDDQRAWYRKHSKHVPYYVCCHEEQALKVGIIETATNTPTPGGGLAFDCRGSVVKVLP